MTMAIGFPDIFIHLYIFLLLSVCTYVTMTRSTHCVYNLRQQRTHVFTTDLPIAFAYVFLSLFTCHISICQIAPSLFLVLLLIYLYL